MLLTRQFAHCIKLMGDNFLLKNTRVQRGSVQILADIFLPMTAMHNSRLLIAVNQLPILRRQQ